MVSTQLRIKNCGGSVWLEIIEHLTHNDSNIRFVCSGNEKHVACVSLVRTSCTVGEG